MHRHLHADGTCIVTNSAAVDITKSAPPGRGAVADAGPCADARQLRAIPPASYLGYAEFLVLSCFLVDFSEFED